MNRVASLAVLAVILLTGFTGSANAQAIDWKRYCATEGREVLLFVDVTTPYDAQDKTILVDGLQRIMPGVPVQPQVLKVDERGMPVFPAAGAPGAPAAPAGN